jgi:hypothetical protein
MAVLAPMPRARVRITTAVKPGDRRSWRSAKRQSANTEESQFPRRCSRTCSLICSRPAKLDSRGALRLVRRQSLANVFFREQSEMCLDYGIVVRIHVTAKDQVPQEASHLENKWHAEPHSYRSSIGPIKYRHIDCQYETAYLSASSCVKDGFSKYKTALVIWCLLDLNDFPKFRLKFSVC